MSGDTEHDAAREGPVASSSSTSVPALPATTAAAAPDVDMAEGMPSSAAARASSVAATAEEDAAARAELPFAQEDTEGAAAEAEIQLPPARVTFLSYLSSPVITLQVGKEGEPASLTAHQGLLVRSPFLAAACAQFVDDNSPREIELSEDMDAVGCFLEYLYTGDYFPRKSAGVRQLEADPSVPKVDETGDQLLKHARVYTLAEKFGLPQLKKLATSKIHCVNSTAKGEIAYARYVYSTTPKEDSSIRAPVANLWATRSHTLRAEAETEFRDLCLEYPEFGYDVLTRVLDEKLKRERNEKMNPGSSSGRKRARHSNV